MTIARDAIRDALAAVREAVREHATEAASYSPTRDRVLLLPIRADGRDAKVGSLFIPDGGRHDSYNECVVVAVGPGTTTRKGAHIPVEVEPDQVVIVGSHTGLPLEINGVEFRLAKAGDLLAVVA